MFDREFSVNFFCLAAPPYPMGVAPPYPQQGKRPSVSKENHFNPWYLGYGVGKPQPGSGNKKH